MNFKALSPNLTQDNIARIRELFPHCVTEIMGEDGEVKLGVDFDQLRQELSGSLVEGAQERYQLNWPGKRAALLNANTPIARVLRPCPEESVDFESTKNIFIEGENLEALKLLQQSYAGAIDLIYIDPPYNTGENFIYRDRFAMSEKEYHLASGQTDHVGKQLVADLESSGRFHSDWLSMMYSRLTLSRRLLSNQGAIFISIDDEEQDNLKKICDEIFGEENYVNTISVNMKNVAGASGGGEDKRLKKNIEYLHVYVKFREHFEGFENAYDYFPISDLVNDYREEGKSWKYTSVLLDAGEKVELGAAQDGDGNDIRIFERRNFSIRSVAQLQRELGMSEDEVYNRYSTKIFQTQMPQSSIRPRVKSWVMGNGGIQSDLYSIEYVPRSGRNKGTVYEQFYKGGNFRLLAWLKDVSVERDGVLHKKEMRGTYWDYASETKNLSKEGGVAFQNGKKPLSMIRRIIGMQARKDITVLDFFAGSGTTAHAVMASNAEDGGSRRFILVQIAEKTAVPELGFPSVSALCVERIRRAGRSLLEGRCHDGWDRDVGFRVLKPGTSGMTGFDSAPDAGDAALMGIL
jgi:adenine-specific DNA-methyltransferase